MFACYTWHAWYDFYMEKEPKRTIGETLLLPLLYLVYFLGKYCYGVEMDDHHGGGGDYIPVESSVGRVPEASQMVI